MNEDPPLRGEAFSQEMTDESSEMNHPPVQRRAEGAGKIHWAVEYGKLKSIQHVGSLPDRRARAGASGDQGRDPEPDQPALGLRLPSALPHSG